MPADSDPQPIPGACDAAGLSADERDRLTTLLSDIDLSVWFATIDDSPYSLADWLVALLAFDRWLAARAVAARPVTTMLGYIECCTLTLVDTLPPPDLAQLLRENLEHYGFDAVAEARRDRA